MSSNSTPNSTLQAQARFQQAMALHQQGRLVEARAQYLEVLKLEPQHFDSLHLLGVIAYQTGNHQAAVELIGMAIGIHPGAAAFYSNRANALLALGQREAAIGDYDRAVALQPDYAQAWNNRGSALQDLKQLEAALASYDRAVALQPNYAQAHHHRGSVLSELKRAEEAIAAFDRAIQLQPDYADAYGSRGIAERELGRLEAALTSFDQAIARKPDFAEALCNRGIVLLELGRPDQALESLARAITINPGSADAYLNRGIVLQELGRLDEAAADFDRAGKLKPGYASAQALKLYLDAAMCDWRGRDAGLIERLGVSGAAVQPFTMLSLEDDPARHRARSENFTRERYGLLLPVPPASPRRGRLKIGYFSADFHGHAVMYQLIRALELHDPARFEIHAYSFGPEANDAIRTRTRNAVDTFRDVRALSGREIARLAHADGIEVAVDLMGYTKNGRPEIFMHRAAPVQISYLGYPGTLGAGFMDYLIADKILIPEYLRRHYREKIIYLPHGHMATDNTKEISERPVTRSEMGLPEKGFVFCCFNSSYKISPEDFDVWMRLVAKVEGSVLWLVRANAWMERNLNREAERRGVDPARIIFAGRVPMAEHLARHKLADLFLDTFHYTGHATAADALWAGLPLVTRLGQGFPARVGAGILNAMGLCELVADSTESYERLALELAENPRKLASVRELLQARRTTSPLFDSKGLVRHLEDAYLKAHARHLDGLAPEDIEAA